MKEHPILFSAPMVRAILAGKKTQTRRILKLPPWAHPPCDDDDGRELARLARYAPGDRLWVREAWCNDTGAPDEISYRATAIDDGWLSEEVADHRWRPSIHMPRWASRITLRIDDVQVERLQEIGGGDAMAEGVEETEFWTQKFDEKWWDDFEFWQRYPPIAFARLWDSINGKKPGCSWADNPWVCALTFEREGNP